MSGREDGLLLICTRCQAENLFPRLASLSSQENVHTYCSRCNEVTAHRPAGGNTNNKNPPYVAASVSDDQLWSSLEQRARQYNVNLEELRRTDAIARHRVLENMGFPPAERGRLVVMIDKRRATSVPTAVPAPYSTSLPAAPPPMAAPPNYLSPLQSARSPINAQPLLAGLSLEGDTVVARCSVYPNLPAEFWCCACNVLVSSRCHVQGIHKDHPFITLRLAAEAHVRDVTSWNERCRAQLNVIASVLNNLKHADTLLADVASKETQVLEDTVQTIISDLLRWKEQLKADIVNQVATQQSAIGLATRQTENLFAMYSDVLTKTEPLMTNIPPVEGSDRSGDDWALRVLDLVSKLRHVNAEAIPMPKVSVPRISSHATPATQMELVKSVSMPLGVRLPDLLDPGYFNFPNPSVSARLPFTLVASDDAMAKGVMVYNGRTLTRSQDVVPSHHLVLASQVFYSGSTSWEVHIDRMGAGTSRILCGVTVNGSDGEGVVWDGSRIVGPNEGESRVLDERFAWRPGTVLRFHLELDGPGTYLNCFYDREGVARIPLPANGHGWVPAFSVFGPQDQITVVPSATSQPIGRMNEGSSRTAAVAAGDTAAQIQQQQHIISSLQQQIAAVNNRVDNEVFRTHDIQAEAFASPPPRATTANTSAAVPPRLPSASPAPSAPAFTNRLPQQGGFAGFQAPGQAAQPSGPMLGASPSYSVPNRGPAARDPLDTYSPELRRIIRYVEESDTGRR